MSTIKLEFQGKETNASDLSAITSDFEVDKTFTFSSTRGDSAIVQEQVDENTIFQLTTEDGYEWIGNYEDLVSINNNAGDMRAGGEAIRLPNHISAKGGNRAGQKIINNKSLDFISSKVASKAAAELGKFVDGRIMKNKGLFSVQKSLDVKELESIDTNQRYLLLLHGTISSTKKSFGDFDINAWSRIYDFYSGRIISLEHYTVSESPYQNTIDLLKALPDGIELDILSQSRGGLVADALARCDTRIKNKGFTKEEQAQMRKKNPSIAKEMLEIARLSSQKDLTIHKIARVACPASGTILLSKRLDHYLNFALNALQQALGGKLNVVYSVLKNFLLEVVKSKHKTDVFPGLWAMVPDSIFQKINNNEFALPSTLISIAGDAEIGGGLWNSIKVIMTNLYYRQANDFVVDTKAMSRGLKNRAALYKYVHPDQRFNHFKYFSTKVTSQLLSEALVSEPANITKLENIPPGSDSRGVIIDALLELGEVSSDRITGSKKVIVLVPGIMGSNLHHEQERIWMDSKQLRKGGITTFLKINNPKIQSKSAIDKFYGKFKKYFNDRNYEVIIQSFDWRKSVSEEAVEFEKVIQSLLSKGIEFNIASHSMGGLLVREWMLKYKGSWNSFKAQDNSRWIMLGTPWLGSYLVMEVITGHAKKVKQINLIDSLNNKKDLLDIFNKYKGIYELLPINHEDFQLKSFWNRILAIVDDEDVTGPSNDMLTHFAKYKSNVEANKNIKPEDEEHIYYIAGHKKRTVCGYKEDAYSLFKGKHLKYKATKEGDGSVTWDLGIPDGLKSENLYYSEIEHTYLAGKDIIFRAINDILALGSTNVLSKNRLSIGKRGGIEAEVDFEEVVDYYDESQYINNIFDLDVKDEKETVLEQLNVKVFNGDLRWANNPLMVGHFNNDGVVSAERTLDMYLSGKLTERHRMGFYPNKIGEQIIVIDVGNNPPGGVIVGLGNKDFLTGFELAKSVEKAILRYALLARDNFPNMNSSLKADSISTLMIGNAYGKLSMVESARNIIVGVQNANRIIQNIGGNLQVIREIEFVDYYVDKAYESFKTLKLLENEGNTISINVDSRIEKGFGLKEQMLRRESSSWWQSLTTVTVRDKKGVDQPYLKYTAYNGLSNVSQENVHSDLELASYLADELSSQSSWKPEDSKVVFELLLPNAYKDFIRNHRNIEWKMDRESAQFPWEMFHDTNYGNKPTFVESGMIRQLFTTTGEIRPALVTNNSALVIGDPIYNTENLSQLTGALQEAKDVANIFKANRVDTNMLLNSNPLSIVKALFAEEYKILHIASHGFYNPEKKNVGIAIGDGKSLSPGTIKQMTAIPEFVFINCCYSGTINEIDEQYSRNRHKLAANVGTQFIEMGVKAVVVAGWAVDDAAALLFAKTLYSCLFQGDTFGSAVLRARSECYSEHKGNNTWGAYQCYGDPSYRFEDLRYSKSSEEDLILDSEIEMQLRNLISKSACVDLISGGRKDLEKLQKRAENLIEKAVALNVYSAKVKEKEAAIYNNLGLYSIAKLKMEELLKESYSDYSIRIMDKYCNVRMKELASVFDTNNVHKNTELKELRQILDDLNQIPILGMTFSRLCTFASTYKRAAIIDQQNRKKHLSTAAKYYLDASETCDLRSTKLIYPLCSYLIVDYFKSDGKVKGKMKFVDKKDLDIHLYLSTTLFAKSESASNRKEVKNRTSEMQIRICQLLRTKTHREVETNKIINLYKTKILKCINARDLIREIEMMDFIIRMSSSLKKKEDVTAFEKIKSFLETFR